MLDDVRIDLRASLTCLFFSAATILRVGQSLRVSLLLLLIFLVLSPILRIEFLGLSNLVKPLLN